MEADEIGGGKRGRGGRGGRRGRGRGRGGRGRGKRAAVVVSSDEENSLEDASGPAENESQSVAASAVIPEEGGVLTPDQQRQAPPLPVVVPQTIDMEADISQLEAPTFTTISRGPPEPMLRLKWDHKVNLIGEKVLNPMIHCCDQCDKPILLYGRMIPCKHVFCLKCARAEPVKVCPRCNDKVVRVEQSGLGTVFMCTHGGSRYGNTGCRRTYLSQRDLQAHINHRHVTQPPALPLASIASAMATGNELKPDVAMDLLKAVVSGQRKLSESTVSPAIQTPSSLLPLRVRASAIGVGSAAAPLITAHPAHAHSTLTQANIARINTANEQQQHAGKVALHQTLKKTGITQSHHQPPETVADASYYSSVLNSFGSAGGGGV